MRYLYGLDSIIYSVKDIQEIYRSKKQTDVHLIIDLQKLTFRFKQKPFICQLRPTIRIIVHLTELIMNDETNIFTDTIQ